MRTTNNDYCRIADSIAYLDKHFAEQPTLKQIADHAGLSEHHFQRLFKRWAGISPKRFLQYLTAQAAGRLLRQKLSVMDASLDSGLSSTSRLYELFVNVYAMTPGEYRDHGRSLSIAYGSHDSPFGRCLIGSTERGICWLSFADENHQLEKLKAEWQGAKLIECSASTATVVEQIFAAASSQADPIPLHIKGTNLQIRVWEALLKIPFGEVRTYSDVAQAINHPKAVRAVASAIGRNPVSYIVPCHRVIRMSGALGGYGWGLTRKKAMLAWEHARSA